MRQTSRLARRCGLAGDDEFLLLQAVAGVVASCDPDKSPPENAIDVYAKIHEITGIADPYQAAKMESNRLAAANLPRFEQILAQHQDWPQDALLALILRFVIAGNIMDFGALESFDLEAMLERCVSESPAIDHTSQLWTCISSLDKGAKVLYLADNCGEIVFDTLLVRYLAERGLAVTVAVKDAPIINDAMICDAKVAEIDRYATIISNGTACPGTSLSLSSEEFRTAFAQAELIIAKGQGNFEGLSEVPRDIFFLLALKCRVTARHMAALNGLSPDALPGKAEVAIYFSGYNKKR